MTTYRDFKLTDTMMFNFVNLDKLTETYSSSFYGEYCTHWPEYQRICLHPTTGVCMAYSLGKAEGKGQDFHGHVSAVTVAPTFRRLGLGEALMKELEDTTAHVHNAYFVDLFVRKSNKVAQEMYHKLGYIVYRRVLSYYLGDGNKGTFKDDEDALEMRKAMPRDAERQKSSVIPILAPGTERNMLHRTRWFFGAHGFYVAVHPWLSRSGYVKVGCTADLSRRLEMASFTTCFTPEWSYMAVFECEGIKEAFLLEQAVLFIFKDRRVPQRELIKGRAEEIVEGARRVCDSLNLQTLIKMGPTYKNVEVKNLERASVPQESNSVESTPDNGTTKTYTLLKYIETLNNLRESMLHSRDAIENKVDTSASDEFDESCMLDFPDPQMEETIDFNVLRPYQEEAVRRCRMELDSQGATICQMACRCGKTPVAFKIIEYYVNSQPGTKILYLVPGLALLRQTVNKLFCYGLKNVEYLLIGSYTGSVLLGTERVLTMTTDVNLIENTIKTSSDRLLVISTYQSSHMVAKMDTFTLIVFDECHRVCGSTEVTNFNSVLLLPRTEKRLFLTATPAYDTSIKMDNTHLFGGIAYRYYLREGIDAGYVNQFSLRIILGENMDDMNPYFYEAMRIVDKMIVYCRSIEDATQLTEKLIKEKRPDDLAPFDVLLAHSRLGSATVVSILNQFTISKRCILLNIRLFQEGVEIPDLNAVFFAAPRYSSRDIVQSICRPLNKLANKPPSFVFLPATIDMTLPEEHPVNLEKFSTLIPFTDALMDEDPKLFEYLIDPHKVSYDMDVLGVRSLKLSSDRIRRFVLPAIRRGVRYSSQNTDRLHRAARVPWKSAFNELRRIVLECNRYPKNNDAWVVGRSSISMAMFYRYVRKGYQRYLNKESSYLQTYQIQDLESLPLWRTYGLHGPYPWKECLSTLEEYLKIYKRVPPLDVHKGGYIGLDATPFERLSGALMHINQCEAHDKLRLTTEKQEDLDRLCGLYGLKWRKKRDADGKLIPGESSFITESYETFKRLYENRYKNGFQKYLDQYFPGYPAKHERMEDPRNLRRGSVPPRHVSRNESENLQTSGKVMCRVCRRHITVSAWERHVKSASHVEKLTQSLAMTTMKKKSNGCGENEQRAREKKCGKSANIRGRNEGR